MNTPGKWQIVADDGAEQIYIDVIVDQTDKGGLCVTRRRTDHAPWVIDPVAHYAPGKWARARRVEAREVKEWQE
jgi:hypothetical protein